MTPVIPAPVPVPLPAPAWLLQFLLVFTFILHLLPMNLLVGGGVILTASSLLARRDLKHREFTRRASRAMLPIAAFTITLGVAPLLFLQLLYGQLFYTSSVLMAWVWLAVVFLVMAGYYGVYWFNMQHDELRGRAPWVILATTVAFVLVAFIFTQNMTFMLLPQDFYSRYLRGTVGAILGPIKAAGLARVLHFLVGSMAMAGLGTALLSRSWRSEAPELADWARHYGIGWFMGATEVQIAVGGWFILSLPHDVNRLFLGGDKLATALLVGAVGLAVLALLAAPRSLGVTCVAILGTISLMAVIRHMVRVAYLGPYFNPSDLPVQGQWPVFVLFVVLLLAGLATVGWMLYVFFRPAERRMPTF